MSLANTKTLLTTYKTVTMPKVWLIIVYHMVVTYLIHNKYSKTTNSTLDTNIQHLHDKTMILHLYEHMKLQESQIRRITSHTHRSLMKHATSSFTNYTLAQLKTNHYSSYYT